MVLEVLNLGLFRYLYLWLSFAILQLCGNIFLD
jgi:hypothetical protein